MAIRNGVKRIIKGHISLEIDIFGRVTEEKEDIKTNEGKNISEEEVVFEKRNRPPRFNNNRRFNNQFNRNYNKNPNRPFNQNKPNRTFNENKRNEQRDYDRKPQNDREYGRKNDRRQNDRDYDRKPQNKGGFEKKYEEKRERGQRTERG